MIAKSLLVFVGIGITSGFALGLYLAETRDGYLGGMMQAEGPSISVIPEEVSFGAGEQIEFHIMNTGTVPLYAEDGPYGARVTGLSGVQIYTFTVHDIMKGLADDAGMGNAIDMQSVGTGNMTANPSAPLDVPASLDAAMLIVQTLMPGERITMLWDQTRQDGEPVQPGLYKVSVRAKVMTGDEPYANSDAGRVPDMIEDSATITIR